MAVDRAVSRLAMQEELAGAYDLGRHFAWNFVVDLEALTFRVDLSSRTNEIFLLSVLCDDYREIPPYFEFLDPVTGEPGTPRAYPAPKGDSFFHSNRCICAPFNRKAYRSVNPQGPHDDWSIGGWARSTANGHDWSNATKLGDMVMMIQTRLLREDLYGGRMA